MDIGTGPYTWGEWSIGSSVSLVGFDDYYVEGQPAIKNVEFRVISEDGNRYIEVETGGADMCYNLPAWISRLPRPILMLWYSVSIRRTTAI
nr:ABC transporter substrate-binding protein [Oscillibacter sp.]